MHTQQKTSSSQRRPEPFSGALGRVYDFLLDIRARFIDAVPVKSLIFSKILDPLRNESYHFDEQRQREAGADRDIGCTRTGPGCTHDHGQVTGNQIMRRRLQIEKRLQRRRFIARKRAVTRQQVNLPALYIVYQKLNSLLTSPIRDHTLKLITCWRHADVTLPAEIPASR